MSAILAATLLVAPSLRADEACPAGRALLGDGTCGAFGMRWSRERAIPLYFGIGAYTSFVRPTGRGFRGTISDAQGQNHVAFQTADFVRGPLQTQGIDVRFGGFFTPYTYFGVDWGAGAGHAWGDPHTVGDYRIAPRSGVNVVQGHAGLAVGARLPLGRVSLRVEAVTAAQLILLMTNVSDHQGREGTEGPRRHGGTGDVMLALKPRVAVDYWLSPDTTLTAWGDGNAMRPGDFSLGLSLATHIRAFDGAF